MGFWGRGHWGLTKMIYLLLGEDSLAKDKKIAEIKEKVLGADEAIYFDYEVLHAPKLDPEIFKKALINLPAVSSKRLIVIRSIEKLDSHNKDLILEFVKTNSNHADLILDGYHPALSNKLDFQEQGQRI